VHGPTISPDYVNAGTAKLSSTFLSAIDPSLYQYLIRFPSQTVILNELSYLSTGLPARAASDVMFPPSNTIKLDIEALSGICGSISIACWVVVFSPQIFENFRRSSAEGLSVVFIVIWLVGDIFNILGAVLQGVLPTMVSVFRWWKQASELMRNRSY
jgi:hypothetical protein